MEHINWKFVLGILLALVIGLVVVLRLTRSVTPFVPPTDRRIPASGTLDEAAAQKFQAVLDRDVNQLKVPALQAFVLTADGKTWSGTTGTLDLNRQQPMQRDDILRVGSVAKTFTAVIILKLVEEGRLKLDDPIAKWFPNFPRANEITVRQLLNQTGGIPDVIPKVLMKSVIPSTYWKPEELVELIAQDEASFTPRGVFVYSNTNYILLGLIAEKVSGKPFDRLLREQIIEPLKLEHTYFIPYEPTPAKLVAGYDRDLASFPGMLDISADNTSWATAAFASGALASTADDLGIFFERLFAGALLSPASMAEMTTYADASNPGFSEQKGYGLGLMRAIIDGQELVGHTGEFMGSSAIAMYSPDNKYLIVVTSNLSYPNLIQVVSDLQANLK